MTPLQQACAELFAALIATTVVSFATVLPAPLGTLAWIPVAVGAVAVAVCISRCERASR